MNVIRPVLSARNFALMVLFFAYFSSNFALHAEEKVITEIILINGLAELVDLNPEGEVLQRHLSIPDYFSSGRSHKRTLRESLSKTKLFGGVYSEKEEYKERLVFKSPVECRQSLMRQDKTEDSLIKYHSHLQDVNLLASLDTNKSLEALSTTSVYNKVNLRNPIRRQRRLINDRFEYVSLFFEPTNRTSKAIIDV